MSKLVSAVAADVVNAIHWFAAILAVLGVKDAPAATVAVWSEVKALTVKLFLLAPDFILKSTDGVGKKPD